MIDKLKLRLVRWIIGKEAYDCIVFTIGKDCYLGKNARIKPSNQILALLFMEFTMRDDMPLPKQ